MPYLMGERSPHKDPHVRGGVAGLSFRHGEEHVIRSIVEGISFGLRDSIEVMKGMGLQADQVRVTGGGAKSKFWRQMLADVFSSEIVVLRNTEGPAMGAAILAGVGAGIFDDFASTTDRLLPVASSVEPIAENVEIYNGHYRLWRRLYPSLKKFYPKRSKLVMED